MVHSGLGKTVQYSDNELQPWPTETPATVGAEEKSETTWELHVCLNKKNGFCQTEAKGLSMFLTLQVYDLLRTCTGMLPCLRATRIGCI